MDSFSALVEQAMMIANTWMWYVVAGCVFILGTIGTSPLDCRYDATFMHRILVFTRKALMITLPVVLLLLPLVLYFCYAAVINPQGGSPKYVQWYLGLALHYWRLALAAYLAAYLLRFATARYIMPYLSNIRRKYRATLTSDSRTDVTHEKGQYQKKEFDPTEFYQDDAIFFGEDKGDKSIYIPLAIWLETNMQIIGPTRFGKGVLLGNQFSQAIRKGYGVFYIDPKEDEYLPHILADEAKRAGKDFIYCDLNDEGVGGWHPFLGGSLRNKRERILIACGLEDTGGDADFYKVAERGVLDELMKTSCKISGMLALLKKNKKLKENAIRLYGKLVEWDMVKSLSPKGGGVSVEKCMLNNAVVYVKGSLGDSVVKDATRMFILEIIQEARRLKSQRTAHLTVGIDEVRFLMSNQVADATATITGADTNLLLAYQAKEDVKNVSDVNVNTDAVEASINTNCQLKFIYGTQCPKTAEWVEEMSGTWQKMVTQREETEVGHLGQEKWEGHRMVAQEEEAYITKNKMLSLEPGAGVLFQPSQLPQIVFTSFVPTAQDHVFDQQHLIKAIKPAGNASVTTSKKVSAKTVKMKSDVAPMCPLDVLAPRPCDIAAPTHYDTHNTIPSKKSVALPVEPANDAPPPVAPPVTTDSDKRRGSRVERLG